eukprot:TRINITY_DN5104_c0_g1_i8.p1 TRINITY_DN5104_c0_g1~~TRINITY_DN5104_c0_g1_i8.p1  ORF type:complete len:463 (+),score=80.90 TRINITY_DN5104_c0_g1_i8:135-1523(+)
MINSTSTGGGVAEMLPRIISTMRRYELNVHWLVITANDEPEFFALTKKIHNFVHGQNPGNLEVTFTQEDKTLFERVGNRNGEEFVEKFLKKGDVVMIHDPQPITLIRNIRKKFTKKDVACLWRCHIGFEETTPETLAAWSFLESYVLEYNLTIFSAKEYNPQFAPNPRIVYPSLHPEDHKNRFLSSFEIKSILGKAGLFHSNEVDQEDFPYKIKMLKQDKTFVVPTEDSVLSTFGFLDRPLILQISRWDRLKGWRELLEAFVDLKSNPDKYVNMDVKDDKLKRDRVDFIKRMGLVLAGPDSSKISDDPEGIEVFESLVNQIVSCPHELGGSIAMLSLPLEDRWQNALIVNALQRLAEVVIQNSLREGFGLTLLEAMWKQRPCIASNACGLRQQLRPDIDGLMIDDPTSPESVARTINEMIGMGDDKRKEFGNSAKNRAGGNFLVYEQVRRYIDCVRDVLEES